MKLVKCTEINRDNKGVIKGYILVDKDGNKYYLYKDDLKHHIKEGNLKVVNLTLTKGGRLVKAAEKPRDDRMKVYVNDVLIGRILTNHRMTDNEIMCCVLGLSNIDNQKELKRLYDKGNPAVYLDDCGYYQVDVENMRTE